MFSRSRIYHVKTLAPKGMYKHLVVCGLVNGNSETYPESEADDTRVCVTGLILIKLLELLSLLLILLLVCFLKILVPEVYVKNRFFILYDFSFL